MLYIITGNFNTGERWTETADNKRELAAILEKIESNTTCGPYTVRQAMYIVDDWSENRGTHERYTTKAEAMQHARAATRRARILGIRSHVTVEIEGRPGLVYSKFTRGSKYARTPKF